MNGGWRAGAEAPGFFLSAPTGRRRLSAEVGHSTGPVPRRVECALWDAHCGAVAFDSWVHMIRESRLTSAKLVELLDPELHFLDVRLDLIPHRYTYLSFGWLGMLPSGISCHLAIEQINVGLTYLLELSKKPQVYLAPISFNHARQEHLFHNTLQGDSELLAYVADQQVMRCLVARFDALLRLPDLHEQPFQARSYLFRTPRHVRIHQSRSLGCAIDRVS